jgi:putative DNA primase/helicase
MWPDANIGIAAGNGLLIVDFDRLAGSQSLQRLVLMGSSLPRTPIARTKKGIHIYYAVPAVAPVRGGGQLRNHVGVFPGVEYRTDGGYVVAPPSIHEDRDGTVYQWLVGYGPDTPLAAAPPLLLLPRVQLKLLAKSIEKLDVEKEGRNAVGHWLACQLRDLQVAQVDAEEVMGYYCQAANITVAGADHLYELDEALNTVRSTYSTPPRKPAGHVDDQQDIPFTDIGNAERLISWWGHDLRYTKGMGWLKWDSTHWTDGEAQSQELAKETAKGILKWGLSLGNEEARKAGLSWGIKSSDVRRIKGMLTLASSDPRVHRTDDTFDNDDWTLNVSNGTVDLRTGRMRPHSREDHITKMIPVRFDDSMDCPLWKSFLLSIMAGNENLVHYIKLIAGYCLTPSVDEQCLFFLHGQGSNGKSTMVEVFTRMLGLYAYRVSSEILMAGRMMNPEAPSPVIASMKGSRLVVTSELEDGLRWSESRVKDLTGKDTLSGRHLNKEPINFMPTHKLLVFGNHKPVVRGATEGIWRRIRLIPFNVTFGEKDKDLKLLDKLSMELPGILNWALEGSIEWQKDGLPIPIEVKVATQSYRDDMDLIQQFIDELCILDSKASTPFSSLHRAYEGWCLSRGEKPISSTRFGDTLTHKGFPSEKRGGTMYRSGISLLGEF